MNKTLVRLLTAGIPFRQTRHRIRKKLLHPPQCMQFSAMREQCLLSFAQCQEDIVLHSFLHPVEKGFYIDVGAADPEYLSVTKFFYDRG